MLPTSLRTTIIFKVNLCYLNSAMAHLTREIEKLASTFQVELSAYPKTSEDVARFLQLAITR